MTDVSARATIDAVLDSEIRFLDTSNAYGEAERRIGEVLKSRGLPEDFVVSTKADPLGKDFSGARVRASHTESTARLGVETLDLFYLHDPELFLFDDLTASGGAVNTMVELKRDGLVRGIGVAGGDLDAMRRYVDLGIFDVVLNHNRYTLLDRTAEPLINQTLDAGAAFINAAPYASGFLAKTSRATYQYGAPSKDVVREVQRLRAVCAEYGVSLPALALRFSTQDPRISATVVGVSRPERIAELTLNDAAEIPNDIWSAVEDALGF
ncbi:aldo/keto reductase [Arthrobacter sp. D1-29]